MDTVELYTFEDADGCESTFTTFKAQEAEEYGRKYGLKVIAQQFEYTDSEVAWDFRPDAPVQRRLVHEVLGYVGIRVDRVEEMEKALEFYAVPERACTWKNERDADGGKKAREALGERTSAVQEGEDPHAGRFAAVSQPDGCWSVVDKKTGKVHVADESFTVCDNIVFALTAKDWRGECGDVARSIQRGLHECETCW